MRRFDATFSTSAWPSPRCVIGLASRRGDAGRRGGAGDHIAGERGVEDLSIDPITGEQAVGREIAGRRIVLVQCMDRDPVGSRVGGRGQGFAELGLPIVADPDPVDGAEHDGSALTDQDDAPTAQRMVHSLGRVISQRAANRRRSVDRKDAHSQPLSRARLSGHNDQRQSDDTHNPEHGGSPRMEFGAPGTPWLEPASSCYAHEKNRETLRAPADFLGNRILLAACSMSRG